MREPDLESCPTTHNAAASDRADNLDCIIMETSLPQEDAQQQHQRLDHGHEQPLQPHHLPLPLPPAHLPSPVNVPVRTAQSTPMSSPGLFSPTGIRQNAILANASLSETTSPLAIGGSSYLHPLQKHKVRETHKALIDSDNITGRKLINQYEVIEEIGRGMHGKVKLARNLETGDNVAIKIIPRFSKKRRLGKLTALSPQDKTMKEIAILKKIRHPNVVALLEVIDDPELKKIYMVLEHVELGEIVWRKKGIPQVCWFERQRVEKGICDEVPTDEAMKYAQILEKRQVVKELKRLKMAQKYAGPLDYWSVEYGAAEDGAGPASRPPRIQSNEDFAVYDDSHSGSASRPSSKAPSRTQSSASVAGSQPQPGTDAGWGDNMETPVPMLPNNVNANAAAALEGTMYGAYFEESYRGRSPSMADSIISHMSSIDFYEHGPDAFTDDFSYVPCFTIDQARYTFRDTLLGLEYLHYQGVVHRDIKPANLLWTRDHRVKISDFGVSYFGRPIRDGDQDDDTVSESEAKDFDDDLELAKTVGTPAFFAPELCYTDLDKEQPKVSEQIDVWSLGVTLFCLVFARIPFLAEDEFQMFRKIATEKVCIPKKRLKPVDPATSPMATSLYERQNAHPYRDDNDLEYEDVDDSLIDLIGKMLEKNPEARIRLRDIKRHPWVLEDLSNPIGWLDDTDPARPSSGRRIQVDERDMSAAVVPLTLLERARSVVKKAVGKVIHPLVERSESRSRRRATSSAASSAGDSMANNVPATPYYHSDRRRSLRPDDYFANAIAESHASDQYYENTHRSALLGESAYDPMATVLAHPDDTQSALGEATYAPTQLSSSLQHQRPLATKSSYRFSNFGSHMIVPETQTTPATPLYSGTSEDHVENDLEGMRRARDMTSEDSTRSRSVDRGLFVNTDKRALAHVGLSTAMAPGSIQSASPRRPRAMKSVDLSKNRHEPWVTSPLSSSPQPPALNARYRHGQPHSDPNFENRFLALVEERPRTAHHIENILDAKSPPLRNYNTSNAESFARAKEILFRKQALEFQRSKEYGKTGEVNPVNVPCPPSPDDEEFQSDALARDNAMRSAKSSSTDSIAAIGTPLTSPSETTSPTSSYPPRKSTSDRMLVFQSDPSLPALLSGASSVSADMEGELLGRPGVVSTPTTLLDTTDSLTPPAMSKEPTSGFPIDEVFHNHPPVQSGNLGVDPEFDHSDSTEMASGTAAHTSDGCDEDDDGGSDDDGIFLMAKSKKRRSLGASPRQPRSYEAKRRDTNTSTASDETAKRVIVHDELAHSTDS